MIVLWKIVSCGVGHAVYLQNEFRSSGQAQLSTVASDTVTRTIAIG